jgi:uncharacterized membrane protein YdjX (TVP38/TMEM64 family)
VTDVPRLRLSPRARLALLLIGLVAGLVVFYGADLLSIAEVRAWVEPFGAWGPAIYLVLATVLGCLLVPGPLLAGVSGILFGAWLGTAVTLSASVACAVIALLAGRAVGRPGMVEVSGPRMEAVAEKLESRGTLTVIVARLAPGIPDAPMSYLAGLLRIRPHQIALGTLIGAAPRGFSYTALGGSLDDLTSPVAIVALVVFGLSGLVGAELGRRALRRSRTAHRSA